MRVIRIPPVFALWGKRGIFSASGASGTLHHAAPGGAVPYGAGMPPRDAVPEDAVPEDAAPGRPQSEPPGCEGRLDMICLVVRQCEA
ncbi:hypothetical protein GCM10027187_03120 [Streptosporangium sandarakinum]